MFSRLLLLLTVTKTLVTVVTQECLLCARHELQAYCHLILKIPHHGDEAPVIETVGNLPRGAQLASQGFSQEVEFCTLLRKPLHHTVKTSS